MGGGAAEHALALAERRLDGVVGDGSDDCEAHGRGQRSGGRAGSLAPMRAIQQREFGGPEVLELVETRRARAGRRARC